MFTPRESSGFDDWIELDLLRGAVSPNKKENIKG